MFHWKIAFLLFPVFVKSPYQFPGAITEFVQPGVRATHLILFNEIFQAKLFELASYDVTRKLGPTDFEVS